MVACPMNIGKRVVTVVRRNLVGTRRVLRWMMKAVVDVEIWLLIVLYVILVFSDRIPIAGLAALGLIWIARWVTTGTLSARTSMDMPILGILIMVPVSLYASVDWTLSLPKVYGIILGVALFYAVVNRVHTVREVWLAAFGVVLISAAAALLGLVGTDWFESKLFALPQIYGRLPHLIRGIPRSVGGGFHPNGIGGTLIFFVPVLVSLLLASSDLKRTQFVADNLLLRVWRASHRHILVGCLLLTLFTLILTKSRGSFMGVSVGLLALGIWWHRRFLWAIPAAALGLFVAVQVWGGETLAQFALRMDIVGGGVTGTVQSRMEVWQRAIYMIQDFPYTGIGIGTFEKVANIMYPFFLLGPDTKVTHAHNNLLEAGVDVGIPGLVAYVALLGCFAVAAWRAYHTLSDRALQALIAGLACGMLAHQVFGLTDAFLLGTKPGVVMWMFLGLVAALYVHQKNLRSEAEQGSVSVT